MAPAVLVLLATLYGLRNPGDGGRQLVSIDPATAAVTPISASIDPPNGTSSGVVALDTGGGRFFFVGMPSSGTDWRLYTVDTGTGAVLSSPAIDPATSILGLEYDDAADVLYGMRNPGDGGKQIVTYDPATGVATPISASISPPLGVPGGVTALDAAGHRFFFIGTPSAESDYRIYTIDTATGAVPGNPTITGSASQFFVGLAYPAASAPPPGPTEVTIDVRSTINPRSKGVIPVVIFTTATFDATTVDPSTVRFGPGNASEAHGTGHISDVDGDGDLDLMLHFRTQDAAIPCGATSATLTGQTFSAQAIQGTDRSEEHTSELQSHSDLVCRLLLEKKKKKTKTKNIDTTIV